MTGADWLRAVKDEAVLREFEDMDDREFRRMVATALMEIANRQEETNAALSDLKRPPWKGVPHALGGVFGGAAAVFFGTKGMNG